MTLPLELNETSVTSSADHQEQPSRFNIVVLGNTGVGKSALLSYLAGQPDKFTVGDTSASQTQFASSQKCKLFAKQDGVRIRLVDTQGLSDSGGDQTDMANVKDMVEYIRRLGSVDLFLLCLDGSNPRFTPYLQSTVELFAKIFSDFLSHTALVFNKWGFADEEKQMRYKLDYQSKFEQKFGAKKIPCYFVDSFCALKIKRRNDNGDFVEKRLSQRVQDESAAQVYSLVDWMNVKEPVLCDVRSIREVQTQASVQAEQLAQTERREREAIQRQNELARELAEARRLLFESTRMQQEHQNQRESETRVEKRKTVSKWWSFDAWIEWFYGLFPSDLNAFWNEILKFLFH
jgi:predicted GTPase